jgi:hypothetical protein
MPEDDGRLTADERERAVAWLQSTQAPVARCPHCANNQWRIANHLVAPSSFSSSVILGGTAYPHFMVICQICGFVKFFNAIASRVISPVDKPGKS